MEDKYTYEYCLKVTLQAEELLQKTRENFLVEGVNAGVKTRRRHGTVRYGQDSWADLKSELVKLHYAVDKK